MALRLAGCQDPVALRLAAARRLEGAPAPGPVPGHGGLARPSLPARSPSGELCLGCASGEATARRLTVTASGKLIY